MNTEAVREIQHILRTLSFSEPSIPRLTVDGRYGYDTKRAVRRFQELQQLPVSGDVDPMTWKRLQEVYTEIAPSAPRPLTVFPHNEFELNIGDRHVSVPIIKLILNTLSDRYDNLPQAGRGSLYDAETAQAVSVLRTLHGLGDSTALDVDVWDLLALLYNESVLNGGSESP